MAGGQQYTRGGELGGKPNQRQGRRGAGLLPILAFDTRYLGPFRRVLQLARQPVQGVLPGFGLPRDARITSGLLVASQKIRSVW